MASVNAAAIKLIKNNFTAHLDEALNEHVKGAERWAGRVRLMLAFIFGVSAFWIWEREGNGRLICLGLMIVWLAMRLLARARQRSGASTRLVTLYTLIDISIVNLGMAAFAQQGYSLDSTGLFLAYFPLLAVAANRYRTGLVLLAGVTLGLGLAGYLQVAQGRTDLQWSHRWVSVTLASTLGLMLLVGAVDVAWVLKHRPPAVKAQPRSSRIH